VFHMFNSIIIFFTTITLHLLDTILPIDETHIRRIMQNFIPEFFDASDSYMFLILLYFIGVSTIGGIALIGTGTMLIAYLKHACGMFKIASYRIEKAMTANMLKNISFEKEIIICKEIIHALNIHRRAIKYNVPWYIAPLHIQRLILFLLQSGGKVFRPTLIGGIFSLSIEFFAAVKNYYKRSI
ncbi:hypothetical protein ALC62_06268, partial [Cyphomyrmex costatus]